jgi:tRNA A37 threonylcarbamoyladenosine biosynthesis protein TsaE
MLEFFDLEESKILSQKDIYQYSRQIIYKILQESNSDKMQDIFYKKSVLFEGELASGKTFFIRNFLKNLNVPFTQSPTFTIANHYVAKNITYAMTKIRQNNYIANQTDTLDIFHLDLYRLQTYEELYELDIRYMLDSAILLIEWANKFSDFFIREYIGDYLIKIEHLGENRLFNLYRRKIK